MLNIARALYAPSAITVVGVGGHDSGYLQTFADWGVDRVTLIDSNKGKFEALESHGTLPTSWRYKNQLISDKADRIQYYNMTNTAESWLLDPEKITGIWNNIRDVEIELRESTTLSDAFGDEAPSNWLAVDCMPAHQIISGLGHHLEKIEIIAARAVSDNMSFVDGKHRVEHLAKHLSLAGFRLTGTRRETNPRLISALFVTDYRSIVRKQQILFKSSEEKARRLTKQLCKSGNYLRKHNSAERGRVDPLELWIKRKQETITELQNLILRLEKSTTRDMREFEYSLDWQDRTLKESQDRYGDTASPIEKSDRRPSAFAGEISLRIGKTRSESLSDEILSLFGPLLEYPISTVIRQLELHAEIHSYMNGGKFQSASEEWPISPDTVATLIGMVEQQHDLIIEFGSGVASGLLAVALSQTRRSHVNIGNQYRFDHIAREKATFYASSEPREIN